MTYIVPLDIPVICEACPFFGHGLSVCKILEWEVWNSWENGPECKSEFRTSRHPNCSLKEVKEKKKAAKVESKGVDGTPALKEGCRWFYRHITESVSDALLAYGPTEFETAGNENYEDAVNVAKEDGDDYVVFQASAAQFKKVHRVMR